MLVSSMDESISRKSRIFFSERLLRVMGSSLELRISFTILNAVSAIDLISLVRSWICVALLLVISFSTDYSDGSVWIHKL